MFCPVHYPAVLEGLPLKSPCRQEGGKFQQYTTRDQRAIIVQLSLYVTVLGLLSKCKQEGWRKELPFPRKVYYFLFSISCFKSLNLGLKCWGDNTCWRQRGCSLSISIFNRKKWLKGAGGWRVIMQIKVILEGNNRCSVFRRNSCYLWKKPRRIPFVI